MVGSPLTPEALPALLSLAHMQTLGAVCAFSYQTNPQENCASLSQAWQPLKRQDRYLGEKMQHLYSPVLMLYPISARATREQLQHISEVPGALTVCSPSLEASSTHTQQPAEQMEYVHLLQPLQHKVWQLIARYFSSCCPSGYSSPMKAFRASGCQVPKPKKHF